ncbi:MAG: GAF domain-containing protein [Verrucomicrobiota bacterium]|nr:GAF domain-containing protein [Verrucomicrobiota bacterium]
MKNSLIDLSKEKRRIVALRKYEILDTPADGSFDDLTALAAKMFNVPIAIISLVDTDRIWFKSHHGLEIEQIDRNPGLCASAILSDDLYLVEDAKNDPRCLANPLVAGEFGLQFYAAAPLQTADGNIGTFCILDKRQHYINTDQQEMLRQMARIVMKEIELRLQSRTLIREYQEKLEALERSTANREGGGVAEGQK